MRQDHVVNEAAAARHKGVGKARLVLGLFGRQLDRVTLVFTKDDFHRALGAHHGDLGIRPGKVHVAAQVLGCHHVIRAAISLARDDGDLRHRAFGVGIKQLGAVLDDAAVLLAGAGHEAGHIDKSHHRDVEGVTKAHEARRLDAALDVQATGQHQRLIGHDAHGLALHAGKADQDVLGVFGLQLEKVAIVHGFDDQLLHVVGLVRVVGHQRVQAAVHAVSRVAAAPHRGFFAVGQRQVVVEAAQHQQRFNVVLKSQVGHATLGGVGDGAAQLLGRHILVRHGLDHLRPGDKHVGAVLDHEDEVGHGGRVHRAAGRRPHDHADLRHHATGHHIALEHIGVAAQAGHALLDAGAARVVEADHRGADLHRLVHHLADFFGVRLGKSATEHGEVLAEHEHQPAVDHAVARNHAIARDLVVLHAEVDTAVFHKHVPLFKGAFIQQQFQPLTGGQLAFFVLGVDALLAAAQAGKLTLGFELFKNVLHSGWFLSFGSSGDELG